MRQQEWWGLVCLMRRLDAVHPSEPLFQPPQADYYVIVHPTTLSYPPDNGLDESLMPANTTRNVLSYDLLIVTLKILVIDL